MVYNNSFYMLQNSVRLYFVKEFHISIHEKYQLIVLFFVLYLWFR